MKNIISKVVKVPAKTKKSNSPIDMLYKVQAIVNNIKRISTMITAKSRFFMLFIIVVANIAKTY